MAMNTTEEVSGNQASDGLTASETALLSLYCVVLIVGVLANAGLAVTVCSQQGALGSARGVGPGARVRSRSPLLLGLCAADLLVCCLSAPLTVCFALLAARPWPFAAPWCKIAFFLQALPVAVSTLSLMLVSVDRYITVKYPRPVGKFQARRHTVVVVAVGAWLLGIVATCPVLAVRRVPPRAGGRCVESWASAEWRGCYVLCRLVLIHVVPGATVLACHLGVKAKLTALSLTARAAHGELPLPVPLLRRPAHVIIVAGIANNTDGKVMTYQPDNESSSDAGQIVDKIRNCNFGPNNKRITMGPSGRKRKRQPNRARRATKSEHEIREENRRLRPQGFSDECLVARACECCHKTIPGTKFPHKIEHRQLKLNPNRSGLPGPGPGGSTLRSRRRLANALVSAAAVFVGCWLPHVVCTVCAELYALPSAQLKQLTQFSLLLGHAHSAINPVIYWALNHQSLHSSCSCFTGSLLGHFRIPTAYRNASSTNEAALGPFHPRFTRPHANVPAVRRQSSCYLY